MLLAGGRGSRLGVLTKNLAKPAVPFGGKYRIIDFPLSNCVNSGIETVGVLTQYQPLELNEYIGSGQPWDLDSMNAGVHILQPYEQSSGSDWYKGTANAIYQNIPFIERYNPDYVVVLSGDHIYKMDYSKMVERHKAVGAACTISVMEVPWSEASRFGIMSVDENDLITEFAEKPKEPKSNLASMGIYVFTWKTLRRYLEALGCAVTVQPVVPGEGADITGADFLFMGAGTERAQRFAAEDFARYSATVKAAAEDGTAMLFAGTAMELLGASVTDRDGDTYPGIGLASFTTVQGKRRIVGDVYGVTALFPEAVVGFMNKCGQIRGVEAPLLTGLSLGFGNEAEKGPEGFHWKNVFASELTGPVLVKNPRLLEAVADAICTRRGISLPEERPSFPYAEAGYAITAEQLKLRAEARQ